MKPYYTNGNCVLYNGDVLDVMRELPAESVDCVVTSPPYWMKRDYGYSEQWGMEPTFQEYLESLKLWMNEVHRVLKRTGTVFVNISDTYYNRTRPGGGAISENKGNVKQLHYKKKQNVPQKSLFGIPARFQVHCIDAGWLSRNVVTWFKPNAMPESARDRFSQKTENVFFFTKHRDYYFNMEAVKVPTISGNTVDPIGGEKNRGGGIAGENGICVDRGKKNPGDVWTYVTAGSENRTEHKACFPEALVERCILSGCPEGGTALDSFCGTGTTGKVAIKNRRRFIGIDASEEYLSLAREKCAGEAEKGFLF